LLDALTHNKNEAILFSCNSPNNFITCSIPVLMLFSWVFCSNDSSFAGSLPNNLENFPSFQDLLICLGEVGVMVGAGSGSPFGGWGVLGASEGFLFY
jgi:hypothetical protein